MNIKEKLLSTNSFIDNGFVGVTDCGQKVYEWKQTS